MLIYLIHFGYTFQDSLDASLQRSIMFTQKIKAGGQGWGGGWRFENHSNEKFQIRQNIQKKIAKKNPNIYKKYANGRKISHKQFYFFVPMPCEFKIMLFIQLFSSLNPIYRSWRSSLVLKVNSVLLGPVYNTPKICQNATFTKPAVVGTSPEAVLRARVRELEREVAIARARWVALTWGDGSAWGGGVRYVWYICI